MRRDAAAAVEVRELQRGAQLVEGIAAEDGGQEGRVGLEDVRDLREDRGQVVDPVEGQRGQHGVEVVFGVGDVFLVVEGVARDGEEGVEGQGGVAVQERRGGVGGCEVRDAGGEGWGGGDGGVGVRVGEGEDACDVAGVGAEVEDVRELALDVLGEDDVSGGGVGVWDGRERTSRRSQSRVATSSLR